MDFSPQTVRSAGFKTVKKGYDPAEVDDFKEKVATAIETPKQAPHGSRAPGRGRQLQEVRSNHQRAREAGLHGQRRRCRDISAHLLAQRTADHTVAQANADADPSREGSRRCDHRHRQRPLDGRQVPDEAASRPAIVRVRTDHGRTRFGAAARDFCSSSPTIEHHSARSAERCATRGVAADLIERFQELGDMRGRPVALPTVLSITQNPTFDGRRSTREIDESAATTMPSR